MTDEFEPTAPEGSLNVALNTRGAPRFLFPEFHCKAKIRLQFAAVCFCSSITLFSLLLVTHSRTRNERWLLKIKNSKKRVRLILSVCPTTMLESDVRQSTAQVGADHPPMEDAILRALSGACPAGSADGGAVVSAGNGLCVARTPGVVQLSSEEAAAMGRLVRLAGRLQTAPRVPQRAAAAVLMSSPLTPNDSKNGSFSNPSPPTEIVVETTRRTFFAGTTSVDNEVIVTLLVTPA